MPEKQFEWRWEANDFAKKQKKAGKHHIKVIPIIRSISGVKVAGTKEIGRFHEKRTVGYVVRWTEYK